MQYLNKFVRLIMDCCVGITYPFIYLYYSHFRLRFDNKVGSYLASTIRDRGIDLRIHGAGVFTSPDKIKIGNYCRIGKNAYFHAKGGIKIGNNVQISRNVTIYTANHNFKSEKYLPYDNEELCGPVSIGNNVWLGMNSTILPNVTIGDNAIIGFGSIITKDVMPNSIVVGNNKVVGSRNDIKNPLLFGKEFPDA